MTEDQIKKIFDPFAQADLGIARKYGGTGLGLTITKKIVTMMGGTLIVESAPGVGSKFSFELLFDTIESDKGYTFTDKIFKNKIKKPLFDGEILLCEDNVMNQQLACENFAKVGLSTVVAENGKIGVDLIMSRMQKNEKQFDLIFMDINMPMMDGLEATSKILELKLGIPIVAMTANVMSHYIELYSMTGMSDFIGKPFTNQELWRCLLKFLKHLQIKENNDQDDDD